ncbi:MAG: formyltransferase family protein [bacterium]|nr:formyltransferase family protein [bacterium]
MKVIFYGGRQAGMIQLLTLLALGHKVVCVIPVDDIVETVAKDLGLEVQKPKNINDDAFVDYLEKLGADLFVCCHGRQIIKPRILNVVKAINTHPCLYKYKGAEPVRRLLEDKNTKASVAVHWMIEKVDEGEPIVENFKEVTSTTVEGVYNELYPLYGTTLIDALKKV